MKKSSLTTAVVAGIVGAAGLVSVSNAVNINPDGLGQALIFPYYTVNKGNNTLISVVNTTAQTKAVKVRFLEGRNSNEVLDFNLYLSPFDVWTGAVITSGPEGTVPANAPPARLVTGDTSCTVPAIGSGVDFVNFEYARPAAGTNTPPKANGPFELARTREGHIEVIEMGNLIHDPADTVRFGWTDAAGAPLNPVTGTLAAAAKHRATTAFPGGEPANCAVLDAAWAGGVWATNRNTQMRPPSGGLFGGAEIVNPANGTNVSYNADAIEGFYTSTIDTLHYEPGDTRPTLAQAQTDDLGNANAIVFNNGTLVEFPFTGSGAGLKAVSAVFMHNQIFNEYTTDPLNPGLASQSEWVITFPTKRLHIINAQPARLPFRQAYDIAAGGACESIGFSFWNREELQPGTPPGGNQFSPRPTTPTIVGPSLCFEAQVVTFNQAGIGDYLTSGNRSQIFGSYYARNICTGSNAECTAGNGIGGFKTGWARITLGDQSPTSTTQNFLPLDNPPATGNLNTTALVGLPVTGFWAANFSAVSGSSALANYSIVHKHRADRLTAPVNVQTISGSPVWRAVSVQ